MQTVQGVAGQHHPVRPTWNPVEEARRNAEMQRAALEQLEPKRKRGKAPVAPPPDPTITTQIRMIADAMPKRQHAAAGEYHAVMVPRTITVTGFFLNFASPAVFVLLNHTGHNPLIDGRFEPDEYAKRMLAVLIVGAAVCQLVGWLWWGVAAALNARHHARWAVSPWYVPVTYLAVAVVAIGVSVSEKYLGDNVIYARACGLAFAVLMYFNTLSNYRTMAESVGAPTKHFTRLIVVPWFVAIAVGVFAWFSSYLPTQALLGFGVGLMLVHGLYGLTMYQAMLSVDRASSGTRLMRQDDQEFAKFLKRNG